MAGGVTKAGVALLAVALAAPGARAAESLPDPTRPPAALRASAAAASPSRDDGSGPVLQSVMISPERLAAIIDGTLVELGGSIGDARLVKVTETGVTLRSAAGTQELRLFPAVDKRPARSAAGAARNAGGKAVRP